MQKEPGNPADGECSSCHPGAGGGLFPDGGRTSQEQPSPPLPFSPLHLLLHFLRSLALVVVLGTLGLVQVSFHGDLIVSLTLGHFGQTLLLND